MAHGGLNDDVVDDGTWPWKVKVVTPVYLSAIILKTARDRDSVTKGHLLGMAYAESNGHVTDDVTWPRKLKVVTSLHLDANIWKTVWDRGLETINH